MAPIPVVVSTPEGDHQFNITKNTLGQELFDQVVAALGMTSVPLYGLQYTDHKDYQAFIKLDKKIMAQDMKEETPIHFMFSAKFFPEAVNEELTHPVIQRLFWRQIRNGIISDEIYCPAELCVLFAAQSMQALHGDYDSAKHPPGFIVVTQEMPARVLDQHGLTDRQWEDRIKNAWAGLKGLDSQQAIMDYLNIAQDLEQYGITYFEVTNKKGTPLWLGVHNLGMDIYEYNNKVTPRLGFPWAEIRNISFNDKKFCIKMTAKDAPDFKFYSPRFKLNKRILALCVGNHQFFVARRRAQAAGTAYHEDRAAFEKKLRKTKDQLLAIRMDLESVLDRSKLTKSDIAHEENEKAGMDKFKTMKKAQSGEAKRRIDDFEDLDATEC